MRRMTMCAGVNRAYLVVENVDERWKDVDFGVLSVRLVQVDSIERRQHIAQRESRDKFYFGVESGPEVVPVTGRIVHHDVLERLLGGTTRGYHGGIRPPR